MTRAIMKADADVYRVQLNRHERVKIRENEFGSPVYMVSRDRIEKTWFEGPYGTIGAARGRLSSQTADGRYRPAHTGAVQRIRRVAESGGERVLVWEDVYTKGLDQ